MTKKISFRNPCFDKNAPRICGGALIGGIVEWPVAPDGTPLILIMSIPTNFLTENVGSKFHQGHFISVFSYYLKDEYFLDMITYHGSQEELSWLRKGYTRVIVHACGEEKFGTTTFPPMCIETENELDEKIPFGGSKLGGKPNLLQAEPLNLENEEFFLQLYAGNFNEPCREIFGLSDAIGYLFINHNEAASKNGMDNGTFFVQVT